MPTLRLLATGAGSEGHGGEVSACAYSPDSAFVLSGGWDGYLRLWESGQGTQVAALQVGKKPVSACAVSPDGKYWLSGSLEGLLGTWDAGLQQQKIIFLAHPRPISAIVYAADGRTLATASWDCNVILWNLNREREGRTLSGHSDIVAGCCFTPDGQKLLSWSHDCTLRLWDVATARSDCQLRGHGERVHAGAVSPEGRFAASGSHDGVVKLWDLTSQTEVGSTTVASEVRGCWFLLDGVSLVVADANGILTQYAVPNLEQQARLITRLPIHSGALAPSGAQIALGSGEGQVYLVAVDEFDRAPLFTTATQSTRRTQSVLQRLVGKSQVRQTYLCTCPVCRHAFELAEVNASRPVKCPGCRRQLRIGLVTRTT